MRFLVTVLGAVALALGIQAFLVKPYRIPSGSMEPTIAVGQRVLVDRIGNRLGDPKVGDIVVFHPPSGAPAQACGDPNAGSGHTRPCDAVAGGARTSLSWIKRVVAGPGDTVAIRDGHVIRNGRRASERSIRPCGPEVDCDFPGAIRIPAGHYFLMGDNRGDSDDSRYWGPVPRSWIVGRAFATYWPVTRLGTL